MQNSNKHTFIIKNEVNFPIINKITAMLKTYSKYGNQQFEINFSNTNFKLKPGVATTLAGTIEHYRKSYNNTINFIGLANYIKHTSIHSPISFTNYRFKNPKQIFDRVLSFETSDEVWSISKGIIDYIKFKFICKNGIIEGLSWCMSEIMDNVLNHSESTKGYIFAQLLKQTNRITISIFDLGRGLLNSLNSSQNYHATDELDAINQAIQKGITRDSNLGQGNGMWGLYQIIKENKGALTIRTGHTQLSWDYRKKENKPSLQKNLPLIDSNIYGTRIDFSIAFDNEFDVIKTLDNYQPESSFISEINDMLINESWIRFNVYSKCHSGFSTRKAGMEARILLSNILNNTTEKILIDFSNIDYISSSFADEFIAKLMMNNNNIKKIHISNCSNFVKSLIDKACKERNIKFY